MDKEKVQLEKFVVMDYSDSSINVHTLDSSDDRDTEDILRSLGYNMDECSFMWCTKATVNIYDETNTSINFIKQQEL